MVRFGFGVTILCLSFLISCSSEENDKSPKSPTGYEDSQGDEIDSSKSSSSSEASSEDSSSSNKKTDNEESNDDSSDSKDSNDSDVPGKSSESYSSSNSSNNGAHSSSSAASPIVDVSDNYTYKTVQIGGQLWLAENLRRTSLLSRCYDYDQTNCETFGRLYNTHDPSCPSDFHLPSKADWETLFQKTGDLSSLKSDSLWIDDEYVGSNKFGFNILPSGICDRDSCYGINTQTNFLVADRAGYYTISSGNNAAEFHEGFDNSLYYSVRCLKTVPGAVEEVELPQNCENGERVKVGFDKIFQCSDGVWLQNYEALPDTCSDEDELKVVLRGYYNSAQGKLDSVVCKSNKWRIITEMEREHGICSAKNQGDTIRISGTEMGIRYSSYYICDTLTWRKASLVDVFGECDESKQKMEITYNSHAMVCADENWRDMTSADVSYGICCKEIDGELSDDGKFICKDGKWTANKN